MIPKEVLKHVRRIQIRTGRLVNEVFAGQYESVFKGRGMEFAEVREYYPGDDIRAIDWNVTARYGRPFVKRFIEERELTIIFLLDLSGSQFFGTRNKFKSELAAEIVALISLSAVQNNDKAGLITFTEEVERYVPPKKGLSHSLRIVRESLYGDPAKKGTNIAKALEYLNEVIKRKAVVFLISDFLGKDFEKALRITNKRHDLIAIKITDEREHALPAVGMILFEDAETGEMFMANSNDKEAMAKFARLVEEENAKFRNLMKSAKMDYIEIDSSHSYVEPLIKFFKMRARRFR